MTGVRRGFTLIETLVALAIMVFLVFALTAFISDLDRRRAALIALAEDHRAGCVLIDAISEQVLTCIARTPSGQPGLRGDATSITIAHRSLSLSDAQERGPASRIVSSTYRFDEAAGTLTIGRTPGGSEVLSARIDRVRFRFHDGTTWRDSYNSSQGGLPVAIEIALWFADPDGSRLGGPSEQERLALELANEAEDNGAPPGAFDLEAELEALGGDELVQDRDVVWPTPDRLRIIAIPDAAWDRGGGASL